MKPKMLSVNCETGEETIRELTDEEIAQLWPEGLEAPVE